MTVSSDEGRPMYSLDDIDRRFVDELARDGRVTSTDLAAVAGISKAVAASRVRRLIEQGVVRVSAVFDIETAGYPFYANCFISSTDSDTARIAKELAGLRSTLLVANMMGRFDLLASFIFADMSEMERLFTEHLPEVAGLGHFESDLVLRPIWFEPTGHNLLVDSSASSHLIDLDVPIRPPKSIIELDELDDALIKSLRVDGRRSNRDIGRELGVSEGTIRTRIRRMQEVNLMRIVGWASPRALGGDPHAMWLRVQLHAVPPIATAERLAAIPDVAGVTAMIGGANVAVVTVSSDRHRMRETLAAVRALPGVAAVEHHEMIETLFHRNHLVRIPAKAVRESGQQWAVDLPASTQTVR